MIDPTKTTPEKLAEMNDSLIIDNNHLRAKLTEVQAELLEAVTALRAIRDARNYNADERWEIANEYLDKHPEFGCYFDGNATKSHDPRGTLRNPNGSRSIFDDVDQ